MIATRPATPQEIEAARARLQEAPRPRPLARAPREPVDTRELEARVLRILRNLAEVGLGELATTIAREQVVTVAQLLGRDRHLGPARARAALCYAIRHHSEREWSYPEIGRLLDLDHSTVLYHVATHARRLGICRCETAAPTETARCAS